MATITPLIDLTARTSQIAHESSAILARVAGGIASGETPQTLIDLLKLFDHDLRNALASLPALVWPDGLTDDTNG